MVRGLLKSGAVPPAQVACTSAADGTGEALADATGIHFQPDLKHLLRDENVDVLVLACKPQQLAAIDPAVADLSAGKLVVSILAGTPLARLQALCPRARNHVRAMPNTPGMIGAGISAFAPAQPLNKGDETIVLQLLGALGEVVPVEENQLDAVTGLSGSGPAYVFEFVAALRDGGVAAGLPEPLALQLARATVEGAARLLAQVPERPETHREWVSSPGGTTLAGLGVLEQEEFRKTIGDAVLAATRRSRELAES